MDGLFQRVAQRPGYQLTVDLERSEVRDAEGLVATFAVDPARRHRLLHGLDDIAMTLQHEDKIVAFERRQHAART